MPNILANQFSDKLFEKPDFTKKRILEWIDAGQRFVVIDHATKKQIEQRSGMVAVVGEKWTGTATLDDGVIVKLA